MACTESATTSISDFGHLLVGDSLGSLRPTSIDQVVDIVKTAAREHSVLTLRGNGWSQSGQSVPDNSLLVSTALLSRVGDVDVQRRTITCEVGATFRSILAHTLAHGLIPRVMPVHLDLTLGGVLSAGGFGSTSHRSGPVVAQVVDGEVVLGTGRVVRAGPSTNREVYDAVFGGVGRCGVIVSAQLLLEPAPRRIRTVGLLYEDLEQLIRDGLEQARADHLEAFCIASPEPNPLASDKPGGGSQWQYGLRVSIGDDCRDGMDADAAFEGFAAHQTLQPDRHTEPGDFAARYDPRFEAMKASGKWNQAHPWFEVFLPQHEAYSYISRALQNLPASLGDGHRISFPADTDRPKALALPSYPSVGFAVLAQGICESEMAMTLEVLRELDALASECGGKRYLSGYLFDTSRAAWRRHYGVDYLDLVRAKREYDPHNIFQSSLPQL